MTLRFVKGQSAAFQLVKEVRVVYFFDKLKKAGDLRSSAVFLIAAAYSASVPMGSQGGSSMGGCSASAASSPRNSFSTAA